MATEDVQKNGWSGEELGEESAYEGVTEISSRLRRGDETAGDPNARDVAGAIPVKDTAHGREASDTVPDQSTKDRTNDSRPRKSEKNQTN
jgi:hypothetical protein